MSDIISYFGASLYVSYVKIIRARFYSALGSIPKGPVAY